jgi:uncharacterized protein YjbJ (UPF0337 family)
MINAQMLKGNWNEIKGQLREKWGQLSDDGLEAVAGNVDQLVGLIQKRTGESREKVERYLTDLTAEGATTVSRFAETARDAMTQSVDTVRGSAQRASESLRSGYDQAEYMVRQRPTETVLAVFAAGVVAGFACGLLCRRD